jgi:hypothetical protein
LFDRFVKEALGVACKQLKHPVVLAVEITGLCYRGNKLTGILFFELTAKG